MRESVTFGAATHIGLVRAKNEDSYAIVENQSGYPSALIIADGMGGHRRGELASRMAVDYVRDELNNVIASVERLLPQTIESHLARIVERANVKVYLGSIEDEENQGMGTTLTAAMIIPGYVVLAHVGDCRAYHLHLDDMTQLTIDHTLVQELVDAGSISPNESREHPNRNVLTRALGVPDYLEPDIVTHTIEPGDRLLLCSDGLHGLIPEKEIKNVMCQAQSADQLACDLVEKALELGGEDNITVLTAFV